MEELLKNADEFLESAKENLKKKRFNASVSDFFKAIVILCDYLIYKEIKAVPKNHNDRFSLLRIHFPEIYRKVSSLFSVYTDSYNLRLGEKEAKTLQEYANGIRKYVNDKK
ncbi:MAG: HEPN domain-containing protein [Nanoarchaeota archaeon]